MKKTNQIQEPPYIGAGDDLFTGWYGQLWKWIKCKHVYSPDDSINVTQTPEGYAISAKINGGGVGGGSSAEIPAYKGYFAIVPDYDNECYMCGNNNYDNIHNTAIAGYVYFGYYTRQVSPLFGIQKGETVWLECSYNGTDYVGELKHGLDADVPEGTPDLNIQIIGYITDLDKIVQVQQGIYDLRFLLM